VTLARTPSQTVGPYYEIGLCRRDDAQLVDPADSAPLRLQGRLFDGEGRAIPDGVVEVWDRIGRRWGRSGTDADGGFAFVVAKPDSEGANAPRLDVFVFARGLLRHQLTRVYFPDEPEANAADPVLSALGEAGRATLVAEPDGGALRFDIHLQGDRETVFFVH
jgi:protocatechuate 3,4-dioxygenase alpha subunit